MWADFLRKLTEEAAKYGYIWFAVGMLGQALFTMRFVVQWLVSEKHGKSVIPIQFWFLSIGGSLLLLFYAIRIKNPVFILGFAFNSLIYGRNLMLLAKERKATEAKDP